MYAGSTYLGTAAKETEIGYQYKYSFVLYNL
jgi:hypothetical protein